MEFDRDWSVGLGTMFGDGQKDRHTHTHTSGIFAKTILKNVRVI